MAPTPSSLPPLDIQRAPEGGEVGVIQSGWRLALREFMSNRLAVIGFGILIFFVLFSFVGPLIYHTDQLDTNLTIAYQAPSASHLFGTDTSGFDELGRMMKGGQAALEIGFFAAFVAIVIGTLWGAVSGLAGGIVDSAMMRVVDIFLSIPFLFVVLILAVKFGATVLSLSLVIGGFA
jgi:ABC-type dipeptide/oligopeptide/nickel transport system permease subunit